MKDDKDKELHILLNEKWDYFIKMGNEGPGRLPVLLPEEVKNNNETM